ncbi:hypothetical protein D8Y22_12730 [Salinadaptatus halalkaliphilus]|uniref:Uncharacterized protein n=1 Tax=Salinadaptatus halalkaliphilus TaxID=2419781 RepID=A0A4S3TK66_9EURY|nr:hypothetical protein [Salinadaptatus halalkaliphilus]THE64502.1 hypothetical protein D8Y22_12730 [Salinadaptatus halalkaliphilus]
MSRPQQSRLAASRQAGDRSESVVLEYVDALRYVPDTESPHYDAIAERTIGATERLPFVGIVVLESGTPVEIKSVSVVYGERQRRGRFQPRRSQHETLLAMGGVYLFAVCTPHDRELIAAKVVPATQMDHLIDVVTNGWRSAGDGRSEEYVQFSWSRVFDPEEIQP